MEHERNMGRTGAADPGSEYFDSAIINNPAVSFRVCNLISAALVLRYADYVYAINLYSIFGTGSLSN